MRSKQHIQFLSFLFSQKARLEHTSLPSPLYENLSQLQDLFFYGKCFAVVAIEK